MIMSIIMKKNLIYKKYYKLTPNSFPFKNAPLIYANLFEERTYDICYLATNTQKTKKSPSFFRIFKKKYSWYENNTPF